MGRRFRARLTRRIVSLDACYLLHVLGGTTRLLLWLSVVPAKLMEAGCVLARRQEILSLPVCAAARPCT